MSNKNVILISGASATGKSSSLMYMADDPGVVYLNCDAGKDIPFKNKFTEAVITDPMDIFDYFEQAEDNEDTHTIVIDTLTYLMDMLESQYVLTASNKMTAWGDYQQYFKKLMQDVVAKSSKNVIFLAHTRSTLDENTAELEVKVPIKGALANNGINTISLAA